jgi:hypothetical protein
MIGVGGEAMILPEVLINQNNILAEARSVRTKERVRILPKEQTRMTINVLSTMAITFVVSVFVLLVLVGSSVNEAIVAGAVAMGAAFINLVRRAPAETRNIL